MHDLTIAQPDAARRPLGEVELVRRHDHGGAGVGRLLEEGEAHRHGGERPPELVADHGEELVLPPVGLGEGGRALGGLLEEARVRFADAKGVLGPMSAEQDEYFAGRLAQIDEMLGG